MVDTSSTGPRFVFATQTLQATGVPVTPGNIVAMLAWMQRESSYSNSPDTGMYNPLNISHDVPGHPAASVNPNGTRNYASWADGVAATAASLHESNFRGILNALQTQPNNPTAVAQAIQSSPWAGGHYGGTLPSTVSDVLANMTPYAGGWIRGPGGPASPLGGAPAVGPGGIELASSPLDLGLPPPLNAGAISSFWSNVFGQASGLGGVGGAIGQVGTALGQIGSILSFVGRAFAWGTNPHNWSRLILGAFATGAIITGVVMIAKDVAPPAVANAVSGITDTATGLAKDAAMTAAAA